MIEPERCIPFGRRAFLLTHTNPLAVMHHIQQANLAGVLDVIAAQDCVLVRVNHATAAMSAQLMEMLDIVDDADFDDAARCDERTQLDIEVVYGAADLDEVAARCAMSVERVIAWHSQAEYRVAFCGFAPGFGYLTGLPAELHLPRRDLPRTHVPAGSVAIAAAYSAVYPRESPGGWHLIGHTRAILFDVDNDPPSLIEPGLHVRFTPVREAIPLGSTQRDTNTGPEIAERKGVEVVQPGMHTIVIDHGRHGWGSIAVGSTGPWDSAAFATATRLVGNTGTAAGLEIVGSGLHLHAHRSMTVAITGAPGPIWIRSAESERLLDPGAPQHLSPGEELLLGPTYDGLRRWLAIRGGLDVPATLGSRSTDTLSGLGPPQLRAGDDLPIGIAYDMQPVVDYLPTSLDEGRGDQTLTVPVYPGPDAGRIADVGVLYRQDYTVTPQSNRVGIRLHGDPLEAPIDASLHPSYPMVCGAIQLPPNGQPVVLGPDHPVTGGYPVIAVLQDPAGAAQWPPGAKIRFREISSVLL